MAPPGGAAKKRASADGGDDVAARLEAHGERFLASFGGGGGGKSRSAAARTPAERELKAARAARRREAAEAAAAAEPPAPAGDALEALFARSGDGHAQISAPAAAPRSRALPPPPGVATTVFDGRRVLSYAPGTAPPPLPPPAPKRKRGERPEAGSADEDAALKRAFKAIEKEVELFGAGGLEAREKKAWEAKRLVSLGMHAPKRPRIPAFIGFGMAAKAAGREETARLEEAAVNGGRLSKKKAKKAGAAGSGGTAGARERGVAWGGGTDSFHGGMLRLAEPPRAGGGDEGGGGGFNKGFGGVFKSGGGAGKRGKGGKGGKSKGKR